MNYKIIMDPLKENIGIPKERVELDDFFRKEYTITEYGTKAMAILFEHLNLKPEDEIYVTTTFGAFYVASCVTSTIFNYCKPSKILTGKTKAIFVIHEFGVPHKDIIKLRKIADEKEIPLIEDCAHSFNSLYENGKKIGSYGDYSIFSVRKIFPPPFGGILLGKKIDYRPSAFNRKKIDKTNKLLPHFLTSLENYSIKKRANFQLFTDLFKTINLKPLFNINRNISPYLFPLMIENAEEIAEYLIKNEIEAAFWRGKNIVVLPVHQFLEKKDIELMFNLVKDYVKK